MLRNCLLVYCLVLLPVLSALTARAQTLSGTYSFQRQEMVAAFSFTPEGRFSFYYSYGAVDREAKGQYLVENGMVRLISDKPAGKDFRVVNKKSGNSYRIQVLNEPTRMNGAVAARYTTKGDTLQVFSDARGLLSIPEKDCGKIWLQHQFFPDILTLIKDESDTERQFEVAMSPDFYAVSFKGIDLRVDGDTLHCPANYVMPVDNLRFVKRK